MRPKFILIFVLLLAGSFGAAWYFKSKPKVEVSSAPVVETNVETAKKSQPTLTTAAAAPQRVVGSSITPEKRAAAIEAEVDRLRELALKDDAESLAQILADLTHPEKEVRAVAIESAKEFGNSNAIPALKAAAQYNEDTQEKIALLEAAEFLTLPQLTFDTPSIPVSPEQNRASQERIEKKIARREAESADRRKDRSPLPRGATPGSWSTTNESQ